MKGIGIEEIIRMAFANTDMDTEQMLYLYGDRTYRAYYSIIDPYMQLHEGHHRRRMIVTM